MCVYVKEGGEGRLTALFEGLWTGRYGEILEKKIICNMESIFFDI